MIHAQDYDEMLRRTGQEYFVSALHYVRDLRLWANQKKVGLNEPSQPMRLSTRGKGLMLYVQSEIPEAMLDNVVKGLSVRWSLKDNAADPAATLNSVKKRLAYCLLKECGRTVRELEGDELLADEWAIKEMERLGFFRE